AAVTQVVIGVGMVVENAGDSNVQQMPVFAQGTCGDKNQGSCEPPRSNCRHGSKTETHVQLSLPAKGRKQYSCPHAIRGSSKTRDRRVVHATIASSACN